MTELNLLLRFGLSASPLAGGVICLTKGPNIGVEIFGGFLSVVGVILVSCMVYQEAKTMEARRRHVGYGDLK